MDRSDSAGEVLARVADTIEARKAADPRHSYVAALLAKGDDALLKKIGEEATETVLAAKDGDKIRIISEVADLWFHCLIVLARHGLGPADVLRELARREGVSGHAERRPAPDGRAQAISNHPHGKRLELHLLQDRAR